MKVSRRSFLAYSAGTALTLYVYNDLGIPIAKAAAIPGGTLNPRAVPKFLSPLIIPPAMPTSAPNTYDVAVRQFIQQILLSPLPATTVWSYGSTTGPGTFNYPAFTL